ncbi:hypothetical protein [Streptomyces sp. NPDC057636]|uniref:hypothetical protein n=1 Tax=Streptomyces sp. NPDC057636 TaxID=3346189 RepID=UPI0036A283C0
MANEAQQPERDRRDMHFPVILNGLDYLHSSLTALADKPQGRDLKYAVLHLQLGTETLLKARLELHDPALVWTNSQSFNEAKHALGDFTSVGVRGALERLREDVKVKNPIAPDDTDLKALGALRNRLTHYGASDTAVAVEARMVPVLKKLLPFIDDELLPHDDSDDATEAFELMEKIRPLIGRSGGFVQHRLEELASDLKELADTTLRCVSCGHFTLIVEGGQDRFVCRLCGKDHGDVGGMVELYGVGSFYEARTQGGEDPAHECAECSSGDATVLPVETASSPEGGNLVCLFGGHILEGLCEQCRRAANFDLADMCSDCIGNRYAKF